jgi:hypothetical protein
MEISTLENIVPKQFVRPVVAPDYKSITNVNDSTAGTQYEAFLKSDFFQRSSEEEKQIGFTHALDIGEASHKGGVEDGKEAAPPGSKGKDGKGYRMKHVLIWSALAAVSTTAVSVAIAYYVMHQKLVREQHAYQALQAQQEQQQ